MMLASDPVMLDCQLAYLLSAEPQVALGECLQPRAICLPLAEQQALVLSAAYLLAQGQQVDVQRGQGDIHHSMRDQNATRPKLLQLLQLMAETSSCCSWRCSIQQTAQIALHQQHQQLGQQVLQMPHTVVHNCSQLHSQQASSMPTWLSSSTQHCFSWLAAVPASRPTTGNSMALAAAIGEAPPTQLAAAAAADASAREVPAAAPCEAPDSEPGQKQADAATEVQQAMDTDLPPAKRTRLAHGGEGAAGVHGQTQGQKAAAERADVIHVLQQALQQLQALHSCCEVGCLDPQLLRRALAAAATATMQQQPGPVTDLHHQLQQQFKQLSADALQPLLEVLLAANSTAPGSTADATGSTAAVGSGLAYLLSAAVLPRVRHLVSAAPRTLLLSLVTAAQQQPELFASVVLQPLLTDGGLMAVQVQLLAKLMKEVPQLQPRLLQLLVEAAVGLPAGGTSAAAAGQPAAFTPPGELAGLSCCWNDSHAVLMRSLLDSCPRVATSQMDTLVAALKAAAQQPGMAKSASFGQLLMAVVKNYGAVLTKQQVEQLLEAAAATSTFMTKSVVTKLQQLAEQHAAAGGVLQP